MFNNNLGVVTHLASISRTVFDRIVFDYEKGPTKITKHVGLEIGKTGEVRAILCWMDGWLGELESKKATEKWRKERKK